MRICRVMADTESFYGVIDGNRVYRLKGIPFDRIDYTGLEYDLDAVKLLAPCQPSKVVAVGKNYAAHADEMGEGRPKEPLLFLKPSTSVIGPNERIVYPSISKRLDYEGELGVVIGRKCRNIKPGHAREYIFGYTCLNDVTARDIQKSDPQWTRGKGFDTFCPIGPHIETELDASRLSIVTRLNGEVRQKSTTDMMTYNIDELICYIAEVMTLLPGDIVATGTPEGIGSMEEGDLVEVEIEGIGVLENTVVRD